MEKVLIIGSGFLGNYIMKETKNHQFQAYATHFKPISKNDGLRVDVMDIDSIHDCVSKIKPDLVINCAANVQIDLLERNPNLALVNSDGAKNLAMICQKQGIRLLHISTDGVFDGIKGNYTEEDITNPLNVYAKSKAEGERLVMENCSDRVIIRTNFYGFDNGENFLFNWIVNNLKQNKELIGFIDVIFSPLEVSNLSKMILDVANSSYCGILHLSSNEPISKYDFASKIAEILGFDRNLIKKGSVDDYKDYLARRPKNTSLSNKKSLKLLNTPIIPLKDWLYQVKEDNLVSKII